MTFDVEHSRCDLSKSIDCKNGERPGWNPPENCKFPIRISLTITLLNTLGQTEIITERTTTTTTTSTIPYQEPTETERTRSFTIHPTTISLSKFAFSRMLLPNRIPLANTPCTFQGTRPDPDDCRCKQNKC